MARPRPRRPQGTGPIPHAIVVQPLTIRITHWLNVLLVGVLVASGLAIFYIHPVLYVGEDAVPWHAVASLPHDVVGSAGRVEHQVLLLGRAVDAGPGEVELSPPRLEVVNGIPHLFPTFERLAWMEQGRRWHLLAMWGFALNGLLYVGYVLATRRRRERWFHLAELRQLVPMWRFFVARGVHLQIGGYSAEQKLVYTLLVFVGGPLLVGTGLAMSPGLDARFPWLPALFLGRQTARSLHFLVMTGIFLFVPVHVTRVFRSGWPTFWGMVTGRTRAPWEDEDHRG